MKSVFLMTTVVSIFFILLIPTFSFNNISISDLANKLAGMPDPNPASIFPAGSGKKDSFSQEDFYKILKLRETGKADAVPVLEKVLAKSLYQYDDVGFAAAQALFCIGTPDAFNILNRYLLTHDYDSRAGVGCAYEWNMLEPERSAFIERYHLVNLASDLAVKLEVDRKKLSGKYVFTVTIENISNKKFRIEDTDVQQGIMLYLKDRKTGSYRNSAIFKMYMKRPSEWFELLPGESHVFKFDGKLQKMSKWDRDLLGASMLSKFVLTTEDVMFDMGDGGLYEVRAMYEVSTLFWEINKRPGSVDPWRGRAVSKPVVVDFK